MTDTPQSSSVVEKMSVQLTRVPDVEPPVTATSRPEMTMGTFTPPWKRVPLAAAVAEGGLDDLAGGAVVAHGDDVGLIQVDILKQAFDLGVEGFEGTAVLSMLPVPLE